MEPMRAEGERTPPDDDADVADFPERSVDAASVREILSLVLIVVLADLTVYRGEGYGGLAALLLGVPLLVFVGAARRRLLPVVWLMLALLLGSVARLVWCGSPGAVSAGAFLAVCVAMSQCGLPPWVLHTLVFVGQTFAAGHRSLTEYSQLLSRWSPRVPRSGMLSVAFPAATLLVFGGVFVLANPDLLAMVSGELEKLVSVLQQWLLDFAPGPLEVVFWIGVAWLAAGLLRPALGGPEDDFVQVEVVQANEVVTASLYAPFRNTLVSVIGLFVAYLVFEFQTLWFREFPAGFHYSGYAHEGAAWLTLALALATVLLSVIFRGQVLRDSRVGRLKWLAWLWSALNLLLAAAVVHRMLIYVEFNGMTRMRVVGFLGIGSVVGGFVFVVAKIVQRRDFRWLIRRHLWTVTFAGYLYCVLPVDSWVNQYNVRRILDGDSAPSVQISVHPTSAEGLLQLMPLLECSDPLVRNGVSALLAQRLEADRRRVAEADHQHWTAYQLANERLHERLERESGRWPNDSDAANARAEALEEFHAYAWQWF